MHVKFAHVADAHLGAWRKESLKGLVYQAFEQAIDRILDEQVDFVVISGDLYDTSDPAVEAVDTATRGFKKLADRGIPVYGIMGSHDFSVSNKSMVRPLVSAGLFTNVSHAHETDDERLQLDFTQDPNTGIKLAGLRARKRGLEVKDYERLDLDAAAAEEGPKIFVLHTAMADLKHETRGDDLLAARGMLPGGFCYYAGGHIHKTIPWELRNGQSMAIEKNNNVIYPGSLFPVDFLELEENHAGGFCIVEGNVNTDASQDDLAVRWVPVNVKETLPLLVECDGLTVSEALQAIDDVITGATVKDMIVTVRLQGTLASGKISDIHSEDIVAKAAEAGAYETLVNSTKLSSAEYAPTKLQQAANRKEDIEAAFIAEHVKSTSIEGLTPEDFSAKIVEVMRVLGEEQEEGTKKLDYNAKIAADIAAIFDITE
jgi:DNA repair exonuclease SbcCD nuclease subunit